MFSPIPPREEPAQQPTTGFMQGTPSLPPVSGDAGNSVGIWVNFAQHCAAKGMRTAEIREELTKQGVEPQLASEITNHVNHQSRDDESGRIAASRESARTRAGVE